MRKADDFKDKIAYCLHCYCTIKQKILKKFLAGINQFTFLVINNIADYLEENMIVPNLSGWCPGGDKDHI